ncbi:hypothetical protein ACQKML_23975 [Peribacillus frigoritolerans]
MQDKKAYRESLKEQIRKLDKQRSAGEEIDYNHRKKMIWILKKLLGMTFVLLCEFLGIEIQSLVI